MTSLHAQSPPDDQLGAFCRENHVALEGASEGLLAGLTFATKDVFHIAGHRTGFGQPDWLRTHPPAEVTAEAWVVVTVEAWAVSADSQEWVAADMAVASEVDTECLRCLDLVEASVEVLAVVTVVDSAEWIMSGRVPDGARDGYRFVIRLDDSDWALACDEVAESFTLDPDQVRIKMPYIGGGFGAKELKAPMECALWLANKISRPVKLVPTAEESYRTDSRHFIVYRAKTGVKSDGTIMALDIELLVDAGAYSPLPSSCCISSGIRSVRSPETLRLLSLRPTAESLE